MKGGRRKQTPQKTGARDDACAAWDLFQQGWKHKEIAAVLGVTEGAVSQWITKDRAQDPEALRHHPSPGAPPKLRPEQLAQLPELAEDFGFRGQVWIAARVAPMITQEFGVRSHPTHCSRLLRRIKSSRQKPVERVQPTRRSGHHTVARTVLACAKTKAEAEKCTIVFEDQSTLYLLPMAMWTSAPVGQTPVLKVALTRDHLSAMGGLTLDGRLVMHVQNTSYKGPDVVRFLQLLVRKIPGKVLVIWGGAPIHRCQAVKDSLVQGGAIRIHLERLPGSAPELNPHISGPNTRAPCWEAASAWRSCSLMDTTKARSRSGRLEHAEERPAHHEETWDVVDIVETILSGPDYPRKACGMCSSGANSRTFVLPTSINSRPNWCVPGNGSGIAKPFFVSVFAHAGFPLETFIVRSVEQKCADAHFRADLSRGSSTPRSSDLGGKTSLLALRASSRFVRSSAAWEKSTRRTASA